MRARLRAIGALTALVVNAGPAALARVELEYSWAHKVNGQVVRQSTPVLEFTDFGRLSQFLTNEFAQNGPGQSNGTVTLSARGYPDRRELGVHVSAQGNINAWDPQLHVPEIGDTEVAVEIRFTDRVIVSSRSVPAGLPVFFDIQPAEISGRMSVPDPHGDSLGNAAFRAHLSIQSLGVFPGLPQTTVFEHQLPYNGERTWDAVNLQGRLPMFPAPVRYVEVANHGIYEFTFSMYAAAGVTPSTLPNIDPPFATSISSFANTLTWRGIAGFYDGQFNRLTDVVMTSESGFDWLTPVPEPSRWALMACGGACVLLCVLRRKRGRASA